MALRQQLKIAKQLHRLAEQAFLRAKEIRRAARILEGKPGRKQTVKRKRKLKLRRATLGLTLKQRSG